jgi:hypothetical protein
MAEVVSCDMETGQLEFAIDRNHFVAPLDVNDPPRRAATVVRFGDKQFPATPFLIGGTRGFEAEGLGGTNTLFVMQPEGSAVFSNARAGLRVTGICTIREDDK